MSEVLLGMEPIADIEQLRRELVDKVFRWMFWALAIVVPLGIVLRISATGWMNSYIVQITSFGVYTATYIFRERCSWKVKVLMVHATFWRFGLVALYSFGILSPGMLILLLDCILIGMLHPIRIAVIALIATSGVIAVIGGAFILGYLHLPLDPGTYVHLAPAWFTVVMGPFLVAALIVVAVSMFRDSIQILLREVQFQREELKAKNEIIEHQATHDTLTGLPAMRLVMDRLDMAIKLAHREKEHAALIFAQVHTRNLGKDSETVIGKIASRLAGSMRETDTVGRIGGGDFLISVTGMKQASDAQVIALKISEAVTETLSPSEISDLLFVRIGFAIYPNDGESAHDLWSLAAASVYTQKGNRDGSTAQASRSMASFKRKEAEITAGNLRLGHE